MGGMPGPPESFQGSHSKVGTPSKAPADTELLSGSVFEQMLCKDEARVTGASAHTVRFVTDAVREVLFGLADAGMRMSPIL